MNDLCCQRCKCKRVSINSSQCECDGNHQQTNSYQCNRNDDYGRNDDSGCQCQKSHSTTNCNTRNLSLSKSRDLIVVTIQTGDQNARYQRQQAPPSSGAPYESTPRLFNLPVVCDRHHGPGCAMEICVMEKHDHICMYKKGDVPGRNPADDRCGSYECIGRMVFKTCKDGNPELVLPPKEKTPEPVKPPEKPPEPVPSVVISERDAKRNRKREKKAAKAAKRRRSKGSVVEVVPPPRSAGILQSRPPFRHASKPEYHDEDFGREFKELRREPMGEVVPPRVISYRTDVAAPKPSIPAYGERSASPFKQKPFYQNVHYKIPRCYAEADEWSLYPYKFSKYGGKIADEGIQTSKQHVKTSDHSLDSSASSFILKESRGSSLIAGLFGRKFWQRYKGKKRNNCG